MARAWRKPLGLGAGTRLQTSIDPRRRLVLVPAPQQGVAALGDS